jgi:DNA mismatch repair ATPase MutS
MILNEATKKTIDCDFIHSKIKVFSPYGKKLKRELKPFKSDEIRELKDEYNRIEKVIFSINRHRFSFVELRNNFKKVKNLENTFTRIEQDKTLTTTEFFEIKNFIFTVVDIIEIFNKLKLNLEEKYKLYRVKELENLLDPDGYGVNSFYIYDVYSEKLYDIRNSIKELSIEKQKKYKFLLEEIRTDYDVKILRNGDLTIDKEKTSLIEMINSDNRMYYKSETFMNVTFTVKPDKKLEDINGEMEELKLLEEKETESIRKEMSKKMKEFLDYLIEMNNKIGYLDILIAKSYFSLGFKGIKPVITEEKIINITDGRHIILEENLRQNDGKYIPISINLKNGVSLITGANMGGKTVSLKMIGLLLYIAQLGLFVPAKEFRFKPVDFIMTSIGDKQSINKGLSTFGAEVETIKEAILFNEMHGLLLIDELASGTNPTEGFALSKAIIEYFKKGKGITIISTHFDGLVDDDIVHFQVKGLKEIDENIDFKNMERYIDYRLIEVNTFKEVPKDAINISKLMGLDISIIKNAESYLQKGSEKIGK